MGNSSIESNETWQDFTRLLGALGKRQLWKYATVALNQARPWDPCFAQVMRCFIQVMRNDEAFFLVDLDFIFGGSSGFINVTKKKSSILKCQGFLKQSDHQKSADAMPLGPPNRQLLGFSVSTVTLSMWPSGGWCFNWGCDCLRGGCERMCRRVEIFNGFRRVMGSLMIFGSSWVPTNSVQMGWFDFSGAGQWVTVAELLQNACQLGAPLRFLVLLNHCNQRFF